LRLQTGHSDIGFVGRILEFIEVEPEGLQQFAMPQHIAVGVLRIRAALLVERLCATAGKGRGLLRACSSD